MNIDPKLIALHKHWLVADAVSFHLRRSMKMGPPGELGGWLDGASFELSSLLTLSAYYGLLHVVVEGYLELKCEDDAVDRLLEDEARLALFKRFRNGTFHYQKHPLSEKVLDFIVLEGSEKWVGDLNRALKAFFERILPIREALAAFTAEAGREDPSD